MNYFFINIITKGLEPIEDNESNVSTLKDVSDASNSNPSIEKIRGTVKTNEKILFKPVPEDLVREII